MNETHMNETQLSNIIDDLNTTEITVNNTTILEDALNET